MSEYRVDLDIFAGPLDLLLYLVRKDEVDIYDIEIARITDQYLGYVEILKNLDIDLAGDFLVMAATLMEIKSAMLLPKTDAEVDEQEDSGDPRSDLIKQLLEYKRFKDAANMLDASAENQSQKFGRPDVIIEKLEPHSEPEVDMDQVSIWDLLAAFDAVMKATGNLADYSNIKDDTPIDLYQIEILDRLQCEGPMVFERLFEGRNNKMAMVGLFLALLELIREKLIWAEQEEEKGSRIYLKALTDVPAEEAVENAIIARTQMLSEEEIQQQEKQERQEIKRAEIPIEELPPKKQAATEVEIVEPVGGAEVDGEQ